MDVAQYLPGQRVSVSFRLRGFMIRVGSVIRGRQAWFRPLRVTDSSPYPAHR